MKKNITFIIIVLFMFLFNIRHVFADEVKCTYNHDNGSGGQDRLTLKMDFSKRKYTEGFAGTDTNQWWDLVSGYEVLRIPMDDIFAEADYTLQDLWDRIRMHGKCPDKFFVVKLEGYYDGLKWLPHVKKGIIVFNSDLLTVPSDKTLMQADVLWLKAKMTITKESMDNPERWTFNPNDNDSTIKESFTMEFECKHFNENWSNKEKTGLKNLSNTYSKNDCFKHPKTAKCKKIKKKYDNKVAVEKSWCASVISVRDSDTACMQKCLNFTDKLSNLGIETGKKTNGGACNVSARVIGLIYNFLKWLKYIAPVLLIILSMLDFIKALASQDNDAMKKAQQRFVKRLVAAVLLFLLPLIIDYVLRIFGLYDANCDITDMF